jgi:transcriptional regulator with GAF, ATPase, and Fis domain/ligand-binding sensor domain-containing protein
MVIIRFAILMCAFISCWHVCLLASALDEYVFSRTSIEHGLSESIVNAIIQDNQGFLWFGTQDGLNKYDGYRFKIFKAQPGDSTALSSNNIIALFLDHEGIIWIATNGGGLNKFDPATEQFTSYQHNPNDSSSIGSDLVYSICEDRYHNLWVGTSGGGLNYFDRKHGTFTRYKKEENNKFSLSSNYITGLFCDKSGTLWIGTRGSGLNKLIKPSADDPPVFVHYRHDPEIPTTISSNYISHIVQDSSGVLWIGTYNKGLNRLDLSSLKSSKQPVFQHYNVENGLSGDMINALHIDRENKLWVGTESNGLSIVPLDRNDQENSAVIYRHNPKDHTSLSSDRIYSIFEDQTGIVWIGTFGGGLNKLDKYRKKFQHYHHNPSDKNSLNNNLIWALMEDSKGILWAGTNGGGLNRFDRKRNVFTHYIHDKNNNYSISSNIVKSLYQDDFKRLWIGTVGGGLNQLISENPPRFKHYKVDTTKTEGINNNYINVLCGSTDGSLWIGTNYGLNKMIRPEKTDQPSLFKHYIYSPDNPYSLSNNQIWALYEDREGNLWVGTHGGGLNKLLSEVDGTFQHYKHDTNDTTSISSNFILSLYQDTAGTLWIGTFGYGLNKLVLDRENNSKPIFKRYTVNDGLPNEVIYAIQEDLQGKLWISTNFGLTRFDPVDETFKNYTGEDGLQSNEFNGQAYFKSKSGELFFGGINGITSFFPEDIQDYTHVPQIVLTDFKLFNQSVPINKGIHGRTLLTKAVAMTDKIKLSHNENVFSIEFAALDYHIPWKNQYKYKMEGFDDDWIVADVNTRFATYTNLDAGEYTFKVLASNSDGVWNERGRALTIIITPPFWQALWFRSFIAVSLVVTAFGWNKRRMGKHEKRKHELEQQVQEKTETAQALSSAYAQVEDLKNRLHAENVYLQSEIKLQHNFNQIITHSEKLKTILGQIEQVAATEATVLVMGESGTGKELLARAIHSISPRKDRPLVKVDCGALPPNLIESELFGHEKGAFTGAIGQKIGRFELASGGTIFLDEIGELPLELQTKLLRVLQDGEIERLGAMKTIQVDVRVIAATNRNLESEVEKGQFREDLYYRLNVFPINVPPLRERKEDIALLVNYFIKKYNTKLGKKIETIPKETFSTLENYTWPGNVRELENIIERSIIVSSGRNLIIGDWLPKNGSITGNGKITSLEDHERLHIIKVLEMTNWRVSGEKGAAQILQINPQTLISRMKKLDIRKNA